MEKISVKKLQEQLEKYHCLQTRKRKLLHALEVFDGVDEVSIVAATALQEILSVKTSDEFFSIYVRESINSQLEEIERELRHYIDDGYSAGEAVLF